MKSEEYPTIKIAKLDLDELLAQAGFREMDEPILRGTGVGIGFPAPRREISIHEAIWIGEGSYTEGSISQAYSNGKVPLWVGTGLYSKKPSGIVKLLGTFKAEGGKKAWLKAPEVRERELYPDTWREKGITGRIIGESDRFIQELKKLSDIDYDLHIYSGEKPEYIGCLSIDRFGDVKYRRKTGDVAHLRFDAEKPKWGSEHMVHDFYNVVQVPPLVRELGERLFELARRGKPEKQG